MIWLFKYEPIFLTFWSSLALGYFSLMYYNEVDRIRKLIAINTTFDKKRWYEFNRHHFLNNLFSIISGITFAVSFELAIIYYNSILDKVFLFMILGIFYHATLIFFTACLTGKTYSGITRLYPILLFLFKILPIIVLILLLSKIIL